jgi:hypothetical protein
MKISYAITVCNELKEISKLLNFLHQYKRVEDEIVVLLDKPKASQELLDQLYYWYSKEIIILKESEFKGHFADWKNELTSLCKGDYIFQIDADEIPHKSFIENLPKILASSNIDVILTPRINTVEGLTQEHINKWSWNINKNNWINFPDYQWRIYRNTQDIKWINKVHERLDGFKTYASLPSIEEYCLYHHKDIKRQEKQNNYYNTL